MKLLSEENMKAVIYAHYSSDDQREESIEGQIRECMEYAERNDITVLCNYIDRTMKQIDLQLLFFFQKRASG